MPDWWKIGGEAFKVFEFVHGTVSFYMFIIEESIQTVSLAIYLANKAELNSKMKELAQWNKDNLITPLKEFCDAGGYAGFPMNLAFKKFAEASEQAMNFYLSL